MLILKRLVANIERFFAPNYSTCGRCNRPWMFVNEHSTQYSSNRGCFHLCESCWKELKTPIARMPYYRELWLQWDEQNRVEWDIIKKAVLDEENNFIF